MSDLWEAAATLNAARVPVWARGGMAPLPFTPWNSARPAPDFIEQPILMPEEDLLQPATTVDIQAEAFAQGFEEGRRACEEAYHEERLALVRLAESLQALKPEPAGELGLLLAETIDHLVRQIMGEMTIGREVLLARAAAAAEIVSDQAGAMRLRLNPEDLARIEDAKLDIPTVGDPHLTPGTILLETGEGWIEDSPEARLEKLRAALARMGSSL